MSSQNTGFINVDELLPQVTLEQAAAFYGVPTGELHRIGDEVRTRCFLQCGKSTETGDRALAIKVDHPAKQWKCHQYGCGKGGNLVSLCDLLKPGPSGGGRPRGERFKDLCRDLLAMTQGVPPPAAPPWQVTAPVQPAAPPGPAPRRNVPLAESENERARGLVDLDAKFITDPAAMTPAAASYLRRRPFFTSEVCRTWRCGYLPRDSGADRGGGTMRGLIVYPMLGEDGKVLTWFGRDPGFEQKHAAWVAGGRQDREPEKFHFVKGFHRGLELFGQHGRDRLRAHPEYRDTLRQLGLVIVEGPNDVIALDCLGVPAVALCSNMVTTEQVAKIVRFAKEVAGEQVTLMLDCDSEGENGAKQALWELAHQCRVRLAWSSGMFGGRFKNRQPESLSPDEWATVRRGLVA